MHQSDAVNPASVLLSPPPSLLPPPCAHLVDEDSELVLLGQVTRKAMLALLFQGDYESVNRLLPAWESQTSRDGVRSRQ